ncbi:MAG: bifunctional 4-hydroxy-3-methylbut-2-enyl diphosphate reductase/30S ribosomal protein S1, partial [Syntrophomonadaceae bacterium]|nr:bifunctional 4-hydroxy-3-methylbut-2-enyl diphosphate reductase/30S ribosomal protein S1 [Syntrophomonadaceae bacterium]
QGVTNFLADKGVKCCGQITEIIDGGVVIRAHGVPPSVLDEIQNRGLKLVDATCPTVKRIQELAGRLVKEKYQLVVIGDKEHPEVQGIMGWAGESTLVVASLEEAQALPFFHRMAVICQTTKREMEYLQILQELVSHAYEVRSFNTICSASSKRQESAGVLAREVDVMVVIGDHQSSNTRSLAKICVSNNPLTYHIETAADLKCEWFKNCKSVGVTAGASTPDWLIKEVLNWMSELEINAAKDEQVISPAGNQEETFAQMEAEMAESMMEVEKGTILTGRVIQVGQDEVMVDVGGKSEGIIPLRELSVHDVKSASDLVSVGDEFEVMVLRWDDDGTILVSKRRVDQEKALDRLESIETAGETVSGTVLKTVKGGLLVDVGVVGFLPASQVEDGFVRDMEKYVGQELSLEIIEFNREKRRGSQVVLSRSRLLDKEKQARKQKFWDEIAEGQIRQGVVKRITDYGAFIDIGGFDGLLHVSEIDHSRVSRPEDVLSEGQEIEVYVLGADPETSRVSLSRKKILPSPWLKVEEDFPIGIIVTGTVVRLAQFGAFIELAPGIDGLVHISHLADRRVARTEDVVEVGQEVKVKVISVDTDARRIGLSIREADAEMEKEEITEYLDNQEE